MNKYRIYDSKLKKYVDDCFISQSGVVHKILYYDYYEEGYKNNLVAEHYIGLKDKNGMEIYTGDNVTNGRIKSTVVFGKLGYDGKYNGLTGFALETWDCDDDVRFYELDYAFNACDLEVIGNVHDKESE